MPASTSSSRAHRATGALVALMIAALVALVPTSSSAAGDTPPAADGAAIDARSSRFFPRFRQGLWVWRPGD